MSKAAARKPAPVLSVKEPTIVQRKALAGAIDAIMPACERRSTIPVLSGILFEIGNGAVNVTTTNMDQYLGARLAVKDCQTARFVLTNAAEFHALLKLLPDGEVAIVFVEPAGKVIITAGKVEAEFDTLPADDFPSWPADHGKHVDLTFGGDQLRRAIGRVAHAISTEETRYYLNGIHLHARLAPDGSGRAPWFAATDGHRLSLAWVEPELGAPEMDPDAPLSVIIPRSAVPMLLALANRGAVDLRIAGDGRQLLVTQDAFSFASKTVDGTYPDIDRVIPANPQQVAILPVLPVIEATKRALTVEARSKTKGVKLLFEDRTMTLSARCVEGGAVTETVDMPEPATMRFECGVNGKYLIDCLRSFDGAVAWRYTDPASPIVIHAADAPSQAEAAHLIVLMPMRV